MSASITTMPTYSVTEEVWTSTASDLNSWNDLEISNKSEWLEPVQGRTLDLRMLWQVLERHNEQMEEKEMAGRNINTTWELVIVQVSWLAFYFTPPNPVLISMKYPLQSSFNMNMNHISSNTDQV